MFFAILIPNTKKRIKIDQTVSTLISTFISNYANVHGYPGRHLQHDTQTIIYLPMDKDYTKVYANFNECLNIFPEKPFDKIDLCETCEMLKAEIRRANYNEKKELIQKRLDNHKQKAEIEREYYHNNILTTQQFNYIIAENEFPKGTDPGKVLCQTEAHGTYSTFKILKNTFNVNEVLDKIPLKSLSKERQEYLYYEIRKYVDIKFQEITCPKPSWIK
ncbi:chaperonin: PROVISIONAL [Gigaspora margarita]|uniref:Chaperonin: PROVISIONAL n=1 Tax=Gigaspora margarita TaxID=4874 RepID=A0A8H3X6M5_GIGMA|nr:chaperonin: PROVISIONAL [Gigaspora margarita]